MNDYSGIRIQYSLAWLTQYANSIDQNLDGKLSEEEKQQASQLSQGSNNFTLEEIEGFNCIFASPLISNSIDNLTNENFAKIPDGSPEAICPQQIQLNPSTALENRIRLWKNVTGSESSVSKVTLNLPPHDEVYLLFINGDEEDRHIGNLHNMARLFAYLKVQPENMYLATSHPPSIQGIHSAPGTIEGIQNLLAQIAQAPGKQKLLLLYTTGHGSKDGERISLVLENHQTLDTQQFAEQIKQVVSTPEHSIDSIVSISDQCYSGVFPDYLVEKLPEFSIIAVAPNTEKETVICGEWTPFVILAIEQGIDFNGNQKTDLLEAITLSLNQYNQALYKLSQPPVIVSYRQTIPALTQKNLGDLFSPHAGKVILDITAPWCEVCKRMEKEFDNRRTSLPEDLNLYRIHDGSTEAGLALITKLREYDGRSRNGPSILPERIAFPTMIYMEGGKITGVEVGYKSPSDLKQDLAKHLNIQIDEQQEKLRIANFFATISGVPQDVFLDQLDRSSPETIIACYHLTHGDNASQVLKGAHYLTGLPAQKWDIYLNNRELFKQKKYFSSEEEKKIFWKLAGRIGVIPKEELDRRNPPFIDDWHRADYAMVQAWQSESNAVRIAMIEGIALHATGTKITLETLKTLFDATTNEIVKTAIIEGLVENHLQVVESKNIEKEPTPMGYGYNNFVIDQLFAWYESNTLSPKLQIVLLQGLQKIAKESRIFRGVYAHQYAARFLSWQKRIDPQAAKEVWPIFLETAYYFLKGGAKALPTLTQNPDFLAVAQKILASIHDPAQKFDDSAPITSLKFLSVNRGIALNTLQGTFDTLFNKPSLSDEMISLITELLPRVGSHFQESWKQLMATHPSQVDSILKGIARTELGAKKSSSDLLIHSSLTYSDPKYSRMYRTAAVRLLNALPFNEMSESQRKQVMDHAKTLTQDKDYEIRILATYTLFCLSQGRWPNNQNKFLTDQEWVIISGQLFLALQDPSQEVVNIAFTALHNATNGSYFIDNGAYLPYDNPTYTQVHLENVIRNPKVAREGNQDNVKKQLLTMITYAKNPESIAKIMQTINSLYVDATFNSLYGQAFLAEAMNKLLNKAQNSSTHSIRHQTIIWETNLAGEAGFDELTKKMLHDPQLEAEFKMAYVSEIAERKRTQLIPDLLKLLKATQDRDSNLVEHIVVTLHNLIIHEFNQKHPERTTLITQEQDFDIVADVLKNSRRPNTLDTCIWILKEAQNSKYHDLVWSFKESAFPDIRMAVPRYFEAFEMPDPRYVEAVRNKLITQPEHENTASQLIYLMKIGDWDFLAEHLEIFSQLDLENYRLLDDEIPLEIEIATLPDKIMASHLLQAFEGLNIIRHNEAALAAAWQLIGPPYDAK
ncbi:MAG: thioredoxin family protein [Deltaproteobacteria bacterium]|nr:thioredoxin family protein [Deltaproteobacteria bacterium]